MTRPSRRMPEWFEELARYNAEESRGILHTREWRDRMAGLQAAFDAWSAEPEIASR